MPLDRISDLARFVAICNYPSLKEAGDATKSTPMQMSRCLARLEGEFGVNLAIRTTRSLKITPEGRQLQRHCERILAEIGDAEALKMVGNTPSGDLRISLPSTFGLQHVAGFLPEFLSTYPNITLSVSYADEKVDILREDFDIAIRLVDLPDSTLVARTIGTSRYVPAASRSYLRKFGEPVDPYALAAHQCLVFANPTPQDVWVFTGQDGLKHSVKVPARLHSNTRSALTDAVVRGAGIGLFPDAELADGRLLPILPGYRVADIRILLVYPKSTVVPPRVRAFTDFLVPRIQRRIGAAAR
jgi:DNA-binding transcriptional LysR family regulator